jgi:hypothetical protein
VLCYRYKIYKSDLRKQMNDTTNGALKSGRLIVGDDDSEDVLCGMHVMELVVGHASGFIERRKGKKVIDEFPESKDFRDRVKTCVKQFSDRHAKGRMEKFNSFVRNNLGQKPFRVQLPNKTRVAGNFRMYEGAIRCHHALERYVYHNSKTNMIQRQPAAQAKADKKAFVLAKYLVADEWQQLAEFCAIYTKTTSLVMDLQADSAASLSISKLQLTNCILELAGGLPDVETDDTTYSPFDVDDNSVLFDVVIVNDTSQAIPWCPSTPFKDLPRRKMCLPLKEAAGESDHIVLDQRTWSFPIPNNDISTMTMTPTSRKLIERLMKEFQHYFKDTSYDEMICMFLNPFVVIFGIEILVGQRFYGKDFLDSCKSVVIQECLDLFGPKKDAIYEQVKTEYDAMKVKMEAEATPSPGAPAVLVPPGSPEKQRGNTSTKYLLMMKRKFAQQSTTATATGAPIASSMTLEQRQERRYKEEKEKHKENVTQEVDKYLTLLNSFNESTGVDETTGEGIISFSKWTDMLLNFPLPLAQEEVRTHGEKVTDYWGENLVPMDAVYSTKRFDIIGWWTSVDKEKNAGGMFPILALLAMVHLSQPYTNAFLERVFSRGTWIDTARSQRVLDQTFEMRVLDGYNRTFVELAKPALDLKDRVAKVVETKSTSSVIEEAVARFARPLERHNKPKNVVVVVEDADEVVLALAGTISDDSSSEDSGGDDENSGEEDNADEDDEQQPTIFSDIHNEEFHKEVDEVLRYMNPTLGRKHAPASSPPTSTQTQSAHQSAGKKGKKATK